VWRTIKIKLQNSKCDILNKTPFGNILAITGHTLSPRVSKYFVVFIFPSISVNVPTPSKIMHPQNITAWPSQSPDLNIIENVWRTIKIKLQNSKCDILNKKIIVREVKKIWVGLTPVYIQSLYNSISRRIQTI
jgi:hypothetical protein